MGTCKETFQLDADHPTLPKMFWGLIVEPGKKYSQTVENSFHISKATLDLSAATEDTVSLLLDYEGQPEYILCHLNKANKQESLDLNFQQGDTINLFTQGQCPIHLTGYLLGEDDDEDDMTLGEMMEEEEEEIVDMPEKGNKRPMPVNGKANAPQKKTKMDTADKAEEVKEAAAEAPKLSKNQKKKLQQQQKQNTATPPQEAKAPAQQNKKNKDETKVEGESSQKKLPGGLIIEDIVVGSGLQAKSGQKVAVYYEGRLQKNNKKFDQSKKGPGFKFHLGAGEVIKGWDAGVVGMKIGGKRRLIVPSHMAYGKGGSPPVIPPNSTLVFDVELKAI